MHTLTNFINIYYTDNIALNDLIKNVMSTDRFVLASNIAVFEYDMIDTLMNLGINLSIDGDTCSVEFISYIMTNYSSKRWRFESFTNQENLRELIVLLDDCKLKYVSQYSRDNNISQDILRRDENAQIVQGIDYIFGMDTNSLEIYKPQSLVRYYLKTLDERARKILIEEGKNVKFEFSLFEMEDFEVDICLSGQFSVIVKGTCSTIKRRNELVDILLDVGVEVKCIEKAGSYQQLVKYIKYGIEPADNINIGEANLKYYDGIENDYNKALELYPDVIMLKYRGLIQLEL